EADDRLVELQQRLEKVGADEAGDTRDQPAARTLPKQLLNFLVPGTRHNRQTVSPARCCGSPASKSGNDRENFVRVSTFIVRRTIGRHCEIVPRPAAQSCHRIGGDVPHIQSLPKVLKISYWCGVVINAVPTDCDRYVIQRM